MSKVRNVIYRNYDYVLLNPQKQILDAMKVYYK